MFYPSACALAGRRAPPPPRPHASSSAHPHAAHCPRRLRSQKLRRSHSQDAVIRTQNSITTVTSVEVTARKVQQPKGAWTLAGACSPTKPSACFCGGAHQSLKEVGWNAAHKPSV